MDGFHSAPLWGLCVFLLMKLDVLAGSEPRCCHTINFTVYKLHGEVGPDCTIIWLTLDGKVIVEDSGNVDQNTVVSYQHSELTMRIQCVGVCLRLDCLSTGEHKINCTDLCEPKTPEVQTEEDRMSPLNITLITLGSFILLILLVLSSVCVVKHMKHHRSCDFENANTTNDAND
ncbi:uncharacterized protein Hap1MRO34_005924 isoform 2-T2 [Clarias gariepinus]